jgi:PPP family 3-phenylpropionic acid transporter
MKSMKSIQSKYNLIQIFYWLAVCSLSGFAAIFLGAKGLTNTQIGTCTGGACVMTILLSPFFSSITSKFNKISLQTYLIASILISSLTYVGLAFLDLPKVILMALYIFIFSLNTSMVPLLSTISMNYIAQGESLNFGLSRGLGSVSYAVGAVLLSQIAQYISPIWMSAVCLISSVLFVLMLLSTPKTYAQAVSKSTEKESGGNAFSIIKNYPVFFLILCGFMFFFCASTMLGTYLVNIIHNLGGSETFVGISMFFMAASEMPVMTLAPKLMKKFGPLPLIGVAAIFYIARNGLIAFAPNLGVLIIGMMMQGMSYGLMTAVLTYYITDTLETKDLVMGQTLLGIMTSGFGSTMGNVTGGILLDTLGIQTLFVVSIVVTCLGTMTILTTLKASKAVSIRKMIAALQGSY